MTFKILSFFSVLFMFTFSRVAIDLSAFLLRFLSFSFSIAENFVVSGSQKPKRQQNFKKFLNRFSTFITSNFKIKHSGSTCIFRNHTKKLSNKFALAFSNAIKLDE